MTKSMEQIHRIKELQMQEWGPYQIAKELQIDVKTVRKYMAKENFSPQLPVTETRSSKLDPYKPTIEAWLKEDEQIRYKQQARRMSKNGFLELEWHPGEAQADFGECDVILNGSRRTCRFLVVSFPQSMLRSSSVFLARRRNVYAKA